MTINAEMDSEDQVPVSAAIKAAGRVAPQGSAAADPESDIWSGRTQWLHFAGRIALWLFVNLMGAVLIGMLSARVEWLTWVGASLAIVVLVLVSGVLMLGRIVLKVLGTGYRLTSQRLFVERGILSRTTDQIELIRVDDVRSYQSMVNRLFDLGTISLLTTDATDRVVTIEGIKAPHSVAEAVRGRVRSLRAKSVHVESI